jgi:hypothetical protein
LGKSRRPNRPPTWAATLSPRRVPDLAIHEAEGETEDFDQADTINDEDADRMAEEEARRDADLLDDGEPGDGSSSSSSSHP